MKWYKPNKYIVIFYVSIIVSTALVSYVHFTGKTEEIYKATSKALKDSVNSTVELLPEDMTFSDLEVPKIKVPEIDTSGITEFASDITTSISDTLFPNGETKQNPLVTGNNIEFADIRSDFENENDFELVTQNTVSEPQDRPERVVLNVPGEQIDVEVVLVPQRQTVISSSRDGRIKSIPFRNGDLFKKGDVLIEYECGDIEAEKMIALSEKELTRQKIARTEKLFKLNVLSDIENISAGIENRQATARVRLVEKRMESCVIKAQYSGRVVNRLANPNEYTRTDRVLLEVASNDNLNAELLIPSKWLRWVNTGAPIEITINETEQTYSAKIIRIHGEVDPVSQSIQVVASLEPYESQLLPGMSGQAKLDTTIIADAGITGFLNSK